MSFFLNTTVCGFTLYQILAYFLVYSCLGWCLEVVYAAATTGQIVNRGFLNGPVCPIYGFGMVIVLFVLTPFEHSTLALYIGGVILPSALELVGGWALYKLYHTRWWDYSDKPFNIGGYICLEFSLLWGVGTLVMMKAIHPTIAGLVELVPPFIGFLLMCFLYAVYAADVVVTAVAASDLAREVADITLLSSDLRELAALRRLSQRMLERINRNYRSILTINTSLLALGIFGILPPTTTALLHNASTMAISAASMRPYLPAPGGRGAQGKEPGNETA